MEDLVHECSQWLYLLAITPNQKQPKISPSREEMNTPWNTSQQ